MPGMADDDAADLPVIDVEFDFVERWCERCQANTRQRVTTIATGNEFTLRVTTKGTCLTHHDDAAER